MNSNRTQTKPPKRLKEQKLRNLQHEIDQKLHRGAQFDFISFFTNKWVELSSLSPKHLKKRERVHPQMSEKTKTRTRERTREGKEKEAVMQVMIQI